VRPDAAAGGRRAARCAAAAGRSRAGARRGGDLGARRRRARGRGLRPLHRGRCAARLREHRARPASGAGLPLRTRSVLPARADAALRARRARRSRRDAGALDRHPEPRPRQARGRGAPVVAALGGRTGDLERTCRRRERVHRCGRRGRRGAAERARDAPHRARSAAHQRPHGSRRRRGARLDPGRDRVPVRLRGRRSDAHAGSRRGRGRARERSSRCAPRLGADRRRREPVRPGDARDERGVREPTVLRARRWRRLAVLPTDREPPPRHADAARAGSRRACATLERAPRCAARRARRRLRLERMGGGRARHTGWWRGARGGRSPAAPRADAADADRPRHQRLRRRCGSHDPDRLLPPRRAVHGARNERRDRVELHVPERGCDRLVPRGARARRCRDADGDRLRHGEPAARRDRGDLPRRARRLLHERRARRDLDAVDDVRRPPDRARRGPHACGRGDGDREAGWRADRAERRRRRWRRHRDQRRSRQLRHLEHHPDAARLRRRGLGRGLPRRDPPSRPTSSPPIRAGAGSTRATARRRAAPIVGRPGRDRRGRRAAIRRR
jgi:hypothetical protein